jgi:hypothetical protein
MINRWQHGPKDNKSVNQFPIWTPACSSSNSQPLAMAAVKLGRKNIRDQIADWRLQPWSSRLGHRGIGDGGRRKTHQNRSGGSRRLTRLRHKSGGADEVMRWWHRRGREETAHARSWGGGAGENVRRGGCACACACVPVGLEACGRLA